METFDRAPKRIKEKYAGSRIGGKNEKPSRISSDYI